MLALIATLWLAVKRSRKYSSSALNTLAPPTASTNFHQNLLNNSGLESEKMAKISLIWTASRPVASSGGALSWTHLSVTLDWIAIP
jgi:hypothetical protein